jgi:hypothetical protein
MQSIGTLDNIWWKCKNTWKWGTDQSDVKNVLWRPSVWFIHPVVCLTTGPKPLPKRAVHIVRSRVSSFKWEYPFLSLRSSSSFLRLLRRLPVTSISPFIFPSITCCRRKFLRKMWPIQFAFRLHTYDYVYVSAHTPWLTSSEHCS